FHVTGVQTCALPIYSLKSIQTEKLLITSYLKKCQRKKIWQLPISSIQMTLRVFWNGCRARDIPENAREPGDFPGLRLTCKAGRKKLNGGICMKEINIVEIVELNEYGIRVEEQDHPLPLHYFDDNGGSPDGNYDENNIAGTWVVLDGKHEIGTYAYRSIDHCTLVKEKDFRNYLMNILKKSCIEMRPSKGIKKRIRRARLSVGKSGGKRGGSSTFRATLPTSWIREMGLSEKARNLKLEFDGEQIIIKNNEEERKMLEKLLKKAMEEVGKEMDRTGFINDTDDIPEKLLDYIEALAIDLVTNELVSDPDNIELYYEKEEDIGRAHV